MQATRFQVLSLLFLRVTFGFLLIWWGLAKGLDLGVGRAVSDTFYGGAFSVRSLLIVFGWVQVLIGAAIVVGFLLKYLVPVQLAINTFTALSVWYAIIDPFELYLPEQTEFPFPQLFYPSIIIVAAGVLLIAFRRMDTIKIDRD